MKAALLWLFGNKRPHSKFHFNEPERTTAFFT